MKLKAAVIGQPVSHSLSPALFSSLAKKLGVELDYRAEAVASEDLASRLLEFKRNYVGINITIPHKENILQFADEITPLVQYLGAANVLKFENQMATAHNTDVEGISATWADHSVNLKDKNILIVGGGGASRAVAFCAAKAFAKEVFIYNRNFKRSYELIDKISPIFKKTHFSKISVGLAEKFDQPLELIVNATPLGMSGFDGGENYFKEIYKHLKFKPNSAFDLIYKPEVTPFLSISKQFGVKGFGGLDMFVYQALATWLLWFDGPDFKPDIKEELSIELRRILSA